MLSRRHDLHEIWQKSKLAGMRIRGERVEELSRAHHAVFLGGTAEGFLHRHKDLHPYCAS